MQKGALNRAQPKADFPTFVSIPVERCFETANFKLISLEKGRTRVNFFQTTSIRQLSSVIQYFKSVISQSKKKKKRTNQRNSSPSFRSAIRRPRTDASHPHHFYNTRAIPVLFQVSAIPLPLSSFSFSLRKHGHVRGNEATEGKEIKRSTSSKRRERQRGKRERELIRV